MRVYENGKYRDMTASEIKEMEAAEREYWLLVDYNSAVDTEIRKRYTVSQEFAILRQRDEKPEEYAEYYAYCEECKAFCKQMREKYAK